MKEHAANAPSVREQARAAAQDLSSSDGTTTTSYASTGGTTSVYDQNADATPRQP